MADDLVSESCWSRYHEFCDGPNECVCACHKGRSKTETFLGRWLRKRRDRRHFYECEEAEVAAALTHDGPTLEETSPALIELLEKAGDEWGPTGVAKTAAQLVNRMNASKDQK